MKHILLISDTHGKTEKLEKILSDVTFDAVLHMGDIGRQEDEIQKLVFPKPIDIVRGNCDLFSDSTDKLVTSFEKVTVFATHGHIYGVNYGLDRLVYAASEVGASVAIYGHTHVPLVTYENGILIVNPGSLSRPLQIGGRPTYAILTIDEGSANAEIYEVK